MNWSAMILLTAGLAAPQTVPQEAQLQGVPQTARLQGVPQTAQFESYTKAYHTASESHKPMFVVLNPTAGEEAISIDALRADPKISSLLDAYVVAVVDTGTEHGKRVHAAFGSKPLPYVAVIDEEQEKQVYRTSTQVSHENLQTVLAKYKSGAKAASLADQIRLQNDCPLCRRNQTSF